MGNTVGLRYTAPKISAISYLFRTFSLLIMGDTEQPRYTGFRGLSVRGIMALQCIEDVHVTLSRQEIILTKYGILVLDNFQIRLQYWVASLCNRLLPGFSSNQFETFHRCYKHIEDVHVTLSRQEIILTKYGILDLDNFQIRLQYWVASLCNRLLPGFSSNHHHRNGARGQDWLRARGHHPCLTDTIF